MRTENFLISEKKLININTPYFNSCITVTKKDEIGRIRPERKNTESGVSTQNGINRNPFLKAK